MCDKHSYLGSFGSPTCDDCHEHSLFAFWKDLKSEANAKLFEESSNSFWEKRKIQNQTIGEDIGEQRVATDDFLSNGKNGKYGKTFPKFYWVTINPKPEITLSDFQSFCKKVFTKKWIESSIYVLEMAEKFHCHGLIMTNDTKYIYSRARKEFLNSALSVCNAYNQHIFVFVEVDLETAKDKFKYMSGKKVDTKQDHVHDTELFRLEFDIPDYYISKGAILTLLAPSESSPSGGDVAESSD